jgi:DNA-binding beta-propeller fold protein YncE
MKKLPLFLLAVGLANADSLLVLSKGDLTLAIVDPATLKVIARMPSGPDPHEVIASADGKTAYISNYGGGAYNTITVVDLVAHRTTGTIDLGALRGPHGLWFAGGKVWFTAEAAKVIGSYDPATNRIDLVLGTGQNRTHMVWATADAKRLITSDVSSATMTIIDKSAGGRGRGPGGPPPPGGPQQGRGAGGPPPFNPNGDWDETHVAVGPGAEGFDVAPGDKELWAANAGDGTISILDLTARKVSATLQAGVQSANRLKITPDGKMALVSMLANPDVAVFDVATRKLVKRIPVGHGAAGIEITPDGSRAFVACTPDSYVVTIDLRSLTNTGKFDAGKNPDGMAWVRH